MPPLGYVENNIIQMYNIKMLINVGWFQVVGQFWIWFLNYKDYNCFVMEKQELKPNLRTIFPLKPKLEFGCIVFGRFQFFNLIIFIFLVFEFNTYHFFGQSHRYIVLLNWVAAFNKLNNIITYTIYCLGLCATFDF